jgi:phosphoserine aminotransferase
MQAPVVRPQRANFGSGPCSKRPGWSVSALNSALIGRSHRSAEGLARLAETIERTRSTLRIPADYRIGIVPASDTGAVEMALWSLLGARGVDVLAWESFGLGWVNDVIKQLRLPDVRTLTAPYGQLPDLSQVQADRDVVFPWNGTTSGVCVPNGDWLKSDRDGLTICDATSAVYGMHLPWNKLDVTTWSWQKVLGGEAAHGTIVLSPRAVERLENYTPPWPMPKIFRMTSAGKLSEGIFKGSTINTPSMLCVEDALDALKWVEQIGGLDATIARCRRNLSVLSQWVERTPWVEFLAKSSDIRSCTSICLSIVDPWFVELSPEEQSKQAKALVKVLSEEAVAYDINSYVEAPPGLRIWGGATVDSEDLEALTPWLDYAFWLVKSKATN